LEGSGDERPPFGPGGSEAAACCRQRVTVPVRVTLPPYGPVRVTLREQEPLAQLPEPCTVEVPRGPVTLPERVQALASAIAATDNAPIMAVVRMSFFMVVVSL
jgi:hypothetical protein